MDKDLLKNDLDEIVKQQELTIKEHSAKIDFLLKRMSQLETKIEMQACMVSVLYNTEPIMFIL